MGRATGVTLSIVAAAIVLGAIVYFTPKGPSVDAPSTLVLDKNQTLQMAQTVPDISFTLGGKQDSLSGNRGNALLVNFWASWCEPCMEEMPSLAELEKHFAGQNFKILAFNVEEPEANTRQFLQGQILPSNLVFDYPKDRLNAYRISAIPLSVLVDKDGKVKQVFEGPVNWMDPDILREIEAAFH